MFTHAICVTEQLEECRRQAEGWCQHAEDLRAELNRIRTTASSLTPPPPPPGPSTKPPRGKGMIRGMSRMSRCCGLVSLTISRFCAKMEEQPIRKDISMSPLWCIFVSPFSQPPESRSPVHKKRRVGGCQDCVRISLIFFFRKLPIAS